MSLQAVSQWLLYVFSTQYHFFALWSHFFMGWILQSETFIKILSTKSLDTVDLGANTCDHIKPASLTRDRSSNMFNVFSWVSVYSNISSTSCHIWPGKGGAVEWRSTRESGTNFRRMATPVCMLQKTQRDAMKTIRTESTYRCQGQASLPEIVNLQKYNHCMCKCSFNLMFIPVVLGQ